MSVQITYHCRYCNRTFKGIWPSRRVFDHALGGQLCFRHALYPDREAWWDIIETREVPAPETALDTSVYEV